MYVCMYEQVLHFAAFLFYRFQYCIYFYIRLSILKSVCFFVFLLFAFQLIFSCVHTYICTYIYCIYCYGEEEVDDDNVCLNFEIPCGFYEIISLRYHHSIIQESIEERLNLIMMAVTYTVVVVMVVWVIIVLLVAVVGCIC